MKTYICKCGETFNHPRTIYDDKNDEQYDECPTCRRDAFDYTPEYSILLAAQEIEGSLAAYPDLTPERGMAKKIIELIQQL